VNPNEIVGRVIDTFNQAKIPYMLVGAFSSNAYGIARSTNDIDIVVQLGDYPLEQIVKNLSGEFRLDPQTGFERVTATKRYRLVHQSSRFEVDVFELSDDPHDRKRFEQRIASSFFGRAIYLPRPEDVIITKLRWAKGTGRGKDLEDVENILNVQGKNIDLVYVRQWCKEHGTVDILETILKRSEI